MGSEKNELICGVIMPISTIDGCNESHWGEVYSILSEAIADAGFEANIVSNSDEVGIIHKRIIQNLYENPIVVCDVSGKNPNVMFELGLRLAFDKPTIIIKDDKTSYSFDTSAIEHLEYPRDLRFSKINEFKEKLIDKIKATYEKSTSDPLYTTFLKHFGEFTVAKLDKKEVSGQEYIVEELKSIRTEIRQLQFNQAPREFIRTKITTRKDHDIDICMRNHDVSDINKIIKKILLHPDIRQAFIEEISPGHRHICATIEPDANKGLLEALIRDYKSSEQPIRAIRKIKN